jgi:hypothetical protein
MMKGTDLLIPDLVLDICNHIVPRRMHRIRTYDLSVPNAVLYQTELTSEVPVANRSNSTGIGLIIYIHRLLASLYCMPTHKSR